MRAVRPGGEQTSPSKRKVCGRKATSTTPTNVKRRQAYQNKKMLEVAKQDIWSPAKTVRAEAVCVLTTASASAVRPGVQELTRAVGGHYEGTVKKLVGLFPVGSQGRQAVVASAVKSSLQCTGETISSVAKALGMHYEYVRRASKLNAIPNRITSDNHRLHASYSTIGQLECQHILQFVRSETQIKSGQKPRKNGETRYTEQSMGSLYVKFRAESFAMCLAEAQMDPQYAGEIPTDVTVHQANCWHALWKSQQPGFNMVLHLTGRFRQEHNDMLESGEAAKLYPNSTAELRKDGKFDPSTWTIVPRAWKTITHFLAKHVPADKKDLAAKNKWNGISILTETHPHTCPLCTEGPTHVKTFEELERSMSTLPNEYESLKVLQEFRILERKVKKYKRHLKQNNVQRENIKVIEQECARYGSRKAVLYRDFVSFYAPDGSKVRVLVFVLIKGGKPTYIYNINWRSNGRNDVWTYRDALDHIAQKTSLLDDIDTLYICGDHGPHFSATKCFNYESKMYEQSSKWNKRHGRGLEIELEFLCSYHAMNRCDGAGMVLKVACWRCWIEGGVGSWPFTANHISIMVNSGMIGKKTDNSMVAYAFNMTNYGLNLFGAVNGWGTTQKNKNTLDRLRDRCQVRFWWMQDGQVQRLPGVYRARDVSGEGEWVFGDTLHSVTSERGAMCTNCTGAYQFPVYHGDSRCDYMDQFMVRDGDRVQPSLMRLLGVGPQKPPKSKKKQKKSKGATVTNAFLKQFLKSNGLSVKGKKAELVKRAKSFSSRQKQQKAADKRAVIDEGGNDEEIDEENPDDKNDDEHEDYDDNDTGANNNGDYQTDREDVYELEEIIAHQVVSNKNLTNPQDQYQVSWVGVEVGTKWITAERILTWIRPERQEHNRQLLETYRVASKQTKLFQMKLLQKERQKQQNKAKETGSGTRKQTDRRVTKSKEEQQSKKTRSSNRLAKAAHTKKQKLKV